MSRSSMKGFKIVAGVRYVWDLAADAYVPVNSSSVQLTGPGDLQVAKIAEELEQLDADHLGKGERVRLYGPPAAARRHRRVGG